MFIGAFVVIFLCLSTVNSQYRPIPEDKLIVKTAQGLLKGSILTSVKGKSIYSFRGIRFAQPPLGNLRFKAPAPPESWDGIQNAIEDGFACPQPDADTSTPTSEDCLFLNVYTTKLPTSEISPNRSVLVFFHSGGWYSVTGSSKLYGPQYLMDQDIVLVTTNYRLAALGFLSTGDDVLPGNYGMKDQVATLRWVKDNIEAFGGNPRSVTIGGYSVGGASVWLHMMSPMSKGLFHRAISMSPSINTFWDINVDPLKLAKKQAALLNCSGVASKQIADCLLTKDAQEIANTYWSMLDWGRDPILLYTPVIEQLGSEEPFLTESPLKTLLDSNFTNIPLLTGTTKDEFNFLALDVINNSSKAEDMYQNFNEVAPVAFMYEQGSNKSLSVSKAFKHYYLHDQPITLYSLSGLGNLYSDAIIYYGQDLMSRLVSEKNQEPVFSYMFEYQGEYSHSQWPGTNKTFGVVHHDDLIYLFYISLIFPEFTTDDNDYVMVDKLTKLWTNFIQTGNPTPEKLNLLNNITWHKMTPQNLNYLSINSELVMETRTDQGRMNLWNQLFPPTLNLGHS